MLASARYLAISNWLFAYLLLFQSPTCFQIQTFYNLLVISLIVMITLVCPNTYTMHIYMQCTYYKCDPICENPS